MSDYFGSSINSSPVVVFPAGTEIKGARAAALALKDGVLVKAEAGGNVFGISIVETDEDVKAGGGITVQVKDIGVWVAGGEIQAGDELASDAEGNAIPAKAGDFIAGIALSSADKAGTWVTVQVTKSGYKADAKA